MAAPFMSGHYLSNHPFIFNYFHKKTSEIYLSLFLIDSMNKSINCNEIEFDYWWLFIIFKVLIQ